MFPIEKGQCISIHMDNIKKNIAGFSVNLILVNQKVTTSQVSRVPSA